MSTNEPRPLDGALGSRGDSTKGTPVGRGRNLSIRRLFAAAALGAGLAAAVVAPVSASATGHTCSSNDVCIYNSAGFVADPVGSGSAFNPWNAIAGNYPNLYNPFPLPHTYNNPEICNNVSALAATCNENDTISSVRNLSSTRKVRLFNNASYTGGFQTISYLSNDNQVTYNDQISSFCWNDGTAGVSSCTF